MHQCGGGRGVADTHFAKAQHIAVQCGDEVHPCLHGGQALLLAHGGLFGEVAGAWALLAVEQAVAWAEIVVHASVYYIEGAIGLAGENIDGGAVAEEVLHHLPRHALRIGGNAFDDDAMVGRENDDGGLAQCQLRALLDQADLAGQGFQHAETAQRFGLAIDGVFEGAGQCCIGGW
ncbi:hypothetical protein D3C81_1676600 [compost metagenome]